MSYGSTGAANAAPRNNSVSNAIGDFDGCLDRAAKCAVQIQGLCDRIMGPRPQEVTGGIKGAEIPSAILGSIHERRSRFISILDEMERALQNLDGMI